MSEADRLPVVSWRRRREWAIDVVEAMDRDQALEYLRRVAARQRQDRGGRRIRPYRPSVGPCPSGGAQGHADG